MITENDKRKDKFLSMNSIDFKKCIASALRNGDKMIVYSKMKDNIHVGGIADTFEEALYWCKKFYEEDNSVDLCIGAFSSEVIIWTTKDILHELGFISVEEYNKYIDELEFDD